MDTARVSCSSSASKNAFASTSARRAARASPPQGKYLVDLALKLLSSTAAGGDWVELAADVIAVRRTRSPEGDSGCMRFALPQESKYRTLGNIFWTKKNGSSTGAADQLPRRQSLAREFCHKAASCCSAVTVQTGGFLVHIFHDCFADGRRKTRSGQHTIDHSGR